MSNHYAASSIAASSAGSEVPPSPLSPIIDDSITYANKILRFIGDAFPLMEQLNDLKLSDLNSISDEGFVEGRLSGELSTQDQNLHNLRERVVAARGRISDLSRANFGGLQLVFEDPESMLLFPIQSLCCSVANSRAELAVLELSQAVKEIAEAGAELHRLIRACSDPHYDQDYHSSDTDSETSAQTRADALQHRLARALNNWIPPQQQSQSKFHLCRLAQRLVNGIDDGHINYIGKDYLSGPERKKLTQFGGAFQFWKCDECRREVKFYVKASRDSTLELTKETRRLGNVSYRAVLCAKSHLDRRIGANSSLNSNFACPICLAQGKQLKITKNVYEAGEDLVRHMGRWHDETSLPALFMHELHFFRRGQCREGSRYDVLFEKD